MIRLTCRYNTTVIAKKRNIKYVDNKYFSAYTACYSIDYI